MRITIALAAVMGLLTACGGGAATHYDTKSALECLQRTNSMRAGGDARSIFLLFASGDGLSAVEPVFVSFGPATLTGRVPTALGATSREPSWTARRGDARISGFGPYEPPIAKRRHIRDAAAKAAVAKLGPAVRSAIDGCLKRNER